jgi:hypothetical protein
VFSAASTINLYEITKPVGGSWSSTKSEIVNEDATSPSLVQESDGTLRCVFKLNSDGKLYEITKPVGGSWSSTKDVVLDDGGAYYPNLIQDMNGSLRCLFTFTPGYNLYEITKPVGGSWTAKSLVVNAGSYYPNMIQESDGTLRCVFSLGAGGNIYEVTLQRYAQIGAGIISDTNNGTTRYLDFSNKVRLSFPVAGGTVTASLL